jgi:hypothetical protein
MDSSVTEILVHSMQRVLKMDLESIKLDCIFVFEYFSGVEWLMVNYF